MHRIKWGSVQCRGSISIQAIVVRYIRSIVIITAGHRPKEWGGGL